MLRGRIVRAPGSQLGWRSHREFGDADAGAHVKDQRDHRTGLPIVSLYGSKHKPTPEQLKDVDYWAVVGFVLAAQGVSLPPAGLGPANAGTIPIPKR